VEGKASYTVLPVLNNTDGSGVITDTLTNASIAQMSRWPAVVMD